MNKVRDSLLALALFSSNESATFLMLTSQEIGNKVWEKIETSCLLYFILAFLPKSHSNSTTGKSGNQSCHHSLTLIHEFLFMLCPAYFSILLGGKQNFLLYVNSRESTCPNSKTLIFSRHGEMILRALFAKQWQCILPFFILLCAHHNLRSAALKAEKPEI